jgi:hypothetical protein
VLTTTAADDDGEEEEDEDDLDLVARYRARSSSIAMRDWRMTARRCKW